MVTPSGAAGPVAACAAAAAFERASPVNQAGDARITLPIPISACAGCEGTGVRRQSRPDGYTFVQECEGRSAQRRADAYNRAGIPGFYAAKSLELFQPHPETVGAARALAIDLVRTWPEPQPGLLFIGDAGVGKTHLLTAMVRELALAKGCPALYLDFTHLMQDLRATVSRRESAAARIRVLVDTEVLALDDLGRGLLETDYELSVLDELVSRRYNAERLTLMATNLRDLPLTPSGTGRSRSDHNLLEARPRGLADVLGERVVSRLRQMCRFVEIARAPDWRSVHGAPAARPTPRTRRPLG